MCDIEQILGQSQYVFDGKNDAEKQSVMSVSIWIKTLDDDNQMNVPGFRCHQKQPKNDLCNKHVENFDLGKTHFYIKEMILS